VWAGADLVPGDLGRNVAAIAGWLDDSSKEAIALTRTLYEKVE